MADIMMKKNVMKQDYNKKKWMWFKHFSLILTKGVFKQTKEMFQAVYQAVSRH